MSRLDLVIFGATGFTGKYAVEEMVRLAKKYPGMTWGVAGRSEKKLQGLMTEVARKTEEDLSNIAIILADVNDEKSLVAMCKQARVLVNCCGPYRLYGEPVVRAAIEAKTHYVDITGEPQFMETMQLQYDKQARDAGVYIISACGFDSIPSDMGVVFLENNFHGTLNSVRMYVSTKVPSELRGEMMKYGGIHHGTWESLVYGLTYYAELKPLRKKMYPEPLPSFRPKLERQIFHKKGNRWCLPFLGSDESVVYRTQRHLYTTEQKRPVQFKAYLKLGGLLQTVMAVAAAIVIFLMTKTKVTRQLLLDYPRLFTAGLVSHDGPSEKVMKNTAFCFELVGEGWDSGVDVNSTKPNKKVVAKVSGLNPGYGATVTALLYCGITVLKEKDKMPASGGVLTTGIAFKNTNLIKNLNENNFTFKIVED